MKGHERQTNKNFEGQEIVFFNTHLVYVTKVPKINQTYSQIYYSSIGTGQGTCLGTEEESEVLIHYK